MIQKITTRALIKKDGKALLIRRSPGNKRASGKFELPGGKVDFGEDTALALEREVSEELGVRLETVQLHTVLSYVDPDEPDIQYVIIVYLATLSPLHEKIILGQDHDKYVWSKMSELQLLDITNMTKLVLGIEPGTSETDTKSGTSSAIVGKKATDSLDLESIIIYSDGGSRGNPGPSASGFVVMTTDEKILYEGGEYLGITTNNQAEYQAVKLGLEKAKQMGVRKVHFRIDSLLVVNQMLGVYQVKNRDLWPIHVSIKELVKLFETVTFTHVRREFNTLADGMVNKMLDEQIKLKP